MSKKIKIKTAPTLNPPNGTDGNDLIGCYFESNGTPGQFLFYNQQNQQITTIPSPLTSGTDFTFTLDTLFWSVTSFVISESATSGTASGSWVANSDAEPESLPSGGDPESGTFQASDTVVEGESSASANA